MLILLIALVRSENSWIDSKTGVFYDWSKLSLDAKYYYEIEDKTSYLFPTIYSFNLGKNLLTTCLGQFVSATETVKVSNGYIESCSILGRSDMQVVKTLDTGIEITYGGGELCFDISSITNRQISFQLICSRTETDWEITQSSYYDYCHVILKKRTILGCPVEIENNWSWGFIIFLSVLATYCGIGIFYNVYKHNSIKIPNNNFWNYLRGSLHKIISLILETGRNLIRKEKIPAKNDYEAV